MNNLNSVTEAIYLLFIVINILCINGQINCLIYYVLTVRSIVLKYLVNELCPLICNIYTEST